MRRITETMVCDKCGCSHIHAGDGWKVKVVDGKEHDFCPKCAKWLDKLENGRRVREPYILRYPYRPWPRYWTWDDDSTTGDYIPVSWVETSSTDANTAVTLT